MLTSKCFISVVVFKCYTPLPCRAPKVSCVHFVKFGEHILCILSLPAGSRKASRSIASLTCLVLRKCLPQVPLPLTSLKNPNPFSLPLVKISREAENLVSPSSSTKTTTSDLSAQMCSDREERPGGSDEEDEEDESISPESASASFPASDHMKNNSASKRNSLSDCSDSDCVTQAQTHRHVPVENSTQVPDGSSHDVDNLERDRNFSLDTENLDTNIDIDMETYKKYFPELEESQESLSLYYPTSLKPPNPPHLSTSNPESDKGLDARTEVSKFPVIVVPTAVQISCDSITESSSESREGEVKSESSAALFKTAAYFVEEPAPQILGHTSPMKPELLYSKTPSVDRLVCMCDIAWSRLYTLSSL